MTTDDTHLFELENLTLQRGITLPRAEITYKTYGRLAHDKSNVILYPTSYGAQHFDTEWLIGPGRVLDPTDWFIVIPNMFTNGLTVMPGVFMSIMNILIPLCLGASRSVLAASQQ